MGFVCTVVLDALLIPVRRPRCRVRLDACLRAAGVVMGLMFMRALETRPSELVPRVGEVATFARDVRARLRPSPPPAQPEQTIDRTFLDPALPQRLGRPPRRSGFPVWPTKPTVILRKSAELRPFPHDWEGN